MIKNISQPRLEYEDCYRAIRFFGGDRFRDYSPYYGKTYIGAAQESFDNRHRYLSGWKNDRRRQKWTMARPMFSEYGDIPF